MINIDDIEMMLVITVIIKIVIHSLLKSDNEFYLCYNSVYIHSDLLLYSFLSKCKLDLL